MSTFLIRRDKITILLKLLTNHTINHQSGVDNVPHLCIKVAHGDGYGWYGLQILDWDKDHVSPKRKLNRSVPKSLKACTA